MNSPPNSSASNLPFGLPPDVSTFLPKAEAINAITGHPSQENAEARVLGNQSQEWHYQEHKHSGRYFETSNQGVGYENTSQSCQNESSGNVSTIGDCGTEQREVKVYLCDPRLNRKNGGQDLHNPHRLILLRLNGTLCRPVEFQEITPRQCAMNMAMRRDNVSLLIPSSNKIKESQKKKVRGAVNALERETMLSVALV
ncbi:Uncharacterized protein APZ42_028594 [Daphnia magna]|uniref:Uncharacterized protein n=1 Tax=Daphnia magna TaxID=35525 RepID=A0A162D682_9CRUS|nr:Uncharacterized protein APZ42_028594 [Daphnia magna]